jgi:hypothetical protein
MEDQFEEKIVSLTRTAGLKVEYSRSLGDGAAFGPRRWHFYAGDYRLLSAQGLADDDALAFVEKIVTRKESAI